MYAYKRVHEIDAAVIAVAARGDAVVDFAGKHQLEKTYRGFRDLLADRDIDVIDICTPPAWHAAHAAQWSMTGGRSLIRMRCHPLSAVLYLKIVEAKARGERITVAAVMGAVGNVDARLPAAERTYINANPLDVEDWGMLTL